MRWAVCCSLFPNFPLPYVLVGGARYTWLAFWTFVFEGEGRRSVKRRKNFLHPPSFPRAVVVLSISICPSVCGGGNTRKGHMYQILTLPTKSLDWAAAAQWASWKVVIFGSDPSDGVHSTHNAYTYKNLPRESEATDLILHVLPLPNS